MKKMLLELYKEQAVDARIKDRYDEFLNGAFHIFMHAKLEEELGCIGE